MKFNKALRSVSAYARPEGHLVRQTYSGAIVTLLGCSLALVLLISETNQYLYPTAIHEMGVETERHQLVKVALDMTFPALPCSLLSVDMVDSSGDMESDGGSSTYHVEHMHLHKRRLSKDGKPIGRGDYHAPTPDIITIVAGMLVQESRQHMKDMEQEMKDGEGCRVHGFMDVKRMAGNFQITVHLKDWIIVASMMHEAARAAAALDGRNKAVEELKELADLNRVNVSHHITKLAFGPTFPGQVNPLDGFTRIVDHDYGTYSYFVKIVPTTYVSSWWSKTSTCQYSVAEYFSPGTRPTAPDGGVALDRIPAIALSYDMSPLNVKIWFPSRSLGHFFVRLSAVLGGCFALTGWLDGVVHALIRMMGP